LAGRVINTAESSSLTVADPSGVLPLSVATQKKQFSKRNWLFRTMSVTKGKGKIS